MGEMQPNWPPAVAPRQSMSGLTLTLLIGAGCVGGTLLIACAGITTLSFVGFDSWNRVASRVRQRPVAGTSRPPLGAPPWTQSQRHPSGFPPTTFGPRTSPQRSNITITPSTAARAASPPTNTAADDPFARTNPVMSFPRRGQPTRVPIGSQPVTAETPLAAGDRVWAYWGAMWFPAEVAQLEGAEHVQIRYLRSLRRPEVLPRTKLRLPNAADPSATDTEPIEHGANSANPFKRQ